MERASGPAGICQNRKIKKNYVDCLPAGICQNRKIMKNYVDCQTKKNIVWPLSSYENQSNDNTKKLSKTKYRVKKSGSLQIVMVRIVIQPNWATEIKKKNSSQRKKENIKINK
jgi:hypothetical protein